ncbi:DUF2589 domain-containing protein [Salmonella enterica subsp. diarizonae]|nr:DUF2589 domain-containing protein [Salmonella enterica subsp. diarizonae]
MADTKSQKELWAQTTGNVKNDLEIPMDVIASQTQTLTKNWVNGFAEMMFDGIKYDHYGMVDLSKNLKPRMLNVTYNAVENGILTEKVIEMPLLGAVDYPALALDDVELDLNYRVDTNDRLTNKSGINSTTSAQANGMFFGIGASTSTKLTLSQSEQRTRTTDTRASLAIVAKYARLKNSEAVSRIADVLMNNAMNSTGDSQVSQDTSTQTDDDSTQNQADTGTQDSSN